MDHICYMDIVYGLYLSYGCGIWIISVIWILYMDYICHMDVVYGSYLLNICGNGACLLYRCEIQITPSGSHDRIMKTTGVSERKLM